MAIEFEIRMHGEILEFEVSGEYCFQDSIDKFPLVLQAVKVSGGNKCLIDFLSLPEAGGGTEHYKQNKKYCRKIRT